MEPARFSITHTADSSMKNVICDREAEKEGDMVSKRCSLPYVFAISCRKAALVPEAQGALLMSCHSKSFQQITAEEISMDVKRNQ